MHAGTDHLARSARCINDRQAWRVDRAERLMNCPFKRTPLDDPEDLDISADVVERATGRQFLCAPYFRLSHGKRQQRRPGQIVQRLWCFDVHETIR